MKEEVTELRKLQKNIFFFIIMQILLIFYVLSSTLIIAGELSAFEIMVSGFIFFFCLVTTSYIIFVKIYLNNIFFFGSFMIWVQMIFYTSELQTLQTVGTVFISLGLIKAFLELFGISVELKLKKKKVRKTKHRGKQ